MNEHLEGLIYEHRYEGYETRRAAAQAHCESNDVVWPVSEEAQKDLVSRLHYAYQGQCGTCGCWWQDVVMSGLTREPSGCPMCHSRGRWICFAFTFSPPAFESGIPGRNVPPSRLASTVLDPAYRERQELQRRRREVAQKFPSLMAEDESGDGAGETKASEAEENLLQVLESMKNVPLNQMPARLRQIVRKLRGDDPKDEEGKAFEFGRVIDEGGDEDA